MKSLLVMVFFSVSFSLFAQDELKHLTFCQSAEVNAIKGENGTCNLVMTVVKNRPTRTVKCTGMVLDFIPCSIMYSVQAKFSVMSLACGINPLEPTLKQAMAAETITYAVAALVQNENGHQELVNDPSSYFNLSSPSMSVDVRTTEFEGKLTASTSVAINLGEFHNLTNIVCQ